ncbi:3-hydroxyacyl-CoA dehydrogenase [Streptomyces sp. 900116325]
MLEASGGGRLFSVNPDGSDKQAVVTRCRIPGGVAVDVVAGHIYWTNMGLPPENDGSIERVDLDGGNRTTIVPGGLTHTPEQLHLEAAGRKLYWGDREGMRVMRCDLDGSNVETLVQTSRGEDDRRDETRRCVGVAVDPVGGHLYWTRKGPCDAGLGKILRAGVDLPVGVNRSPMDPPYGRRTPEILLTHLMEGIGLALDRDADRMYVTDLTGNVYTADRDGSNRTEILLLQGNPTGIAHTVLPAGTSV